MFRVVLAILLFLHGLIHLLGFFKAYKPGAVTHLTQEISLPLGFIWLATALLFLLADGMMVFKSQSWWIPAALGVIVSQALIFGTWQDAKYGSIINIIALVAVVMQMGQYQFRKHFVRDARQAIATSQPASPTLIREADLQPLPPIVQAYLRYHGAVGKPRVNNMRVEFEGRMRSRKIDWFPFESVQYNTFTEPSRYFYMTGHMKGFAVPGYHRYQQAKASMDVRLFGLIRVAHLDGPVMNKAETVTLFNDMCLLAPSTLIDPRIRWTSIDSLTADASFTNGDITIQARLFFDKAGRLINFESHDRTEINDMKSYPFLTPCRHYGPAGNGYQLLQEGDAVWVYPDSSFTYGEFRLKSVAYNVTAFKD